MVSPSVDVQPSYDLGHQGDLDYTQIARMLTRTPEQRWRSYQRWRGLLKRNLTMTPFLDEIVGCLALAQVEYIIVGGVAGILQGSSLNTLDLDICYRRTPENINRLVTALQSFNPRPRGWPADLPFVFDARTIQLGSNFTLDINGEDLDLLGHMSAIGGYEENIERTDEMTVSGCTVRVLSLEQLITTKEAAGRQKDLVALPILRAALQMKRQAASSRQEPPRGG